MPESAEESAATPEIDTSRAHSARMYDYYLGGKNNFAADREAAEKVLQIWPARTAAREGRTAYIHADLRDPAGILADPVTKSVLDFSRPIALMLVAIVHFIEDEDKPAELIATLVDALPPGSYVVASHITMEHNPAGLAAGQRAYRAAGVPAQARDSSQFAELVFAGLELVPPGVVLVSEWRPDDDGPRPTPAEVSFYGGVARKP